MAPARPDHAASTPSRFIFRHSVVAETARSRATRGRSPAARASAASMACRSASSTVAARVRASRRPGAPVRFDLDVGAAELGVRRERRGLLDHVLELADVARARRARRAARARPARASSRAPVRWAKRVEEVRGEERHVLAALAQRRDPERHHVEPVVEVLAEALLGDRAARGPGSSRR